MSKLRQALLLTAKVDPEGTKLEQAQREKHQRIQAAKRGNPRKTYRLPYLR